MGQRVKLKKDRTSVKGYAVKVQNMSRKNGGQASNKTGSPSNRRKKKKRKSN